jgi:hypothetical protein
MEHPCLKEFAKTGAPLAAIRQYSSVLPVALCGFTRYRSRALGPEFQDRFLSTLANSQSHGKPVMNATQNLKTTGKNLIDVGGVKGILVYRSRDEDVSRTGVGISGASRCCVSWADQSVSATG